LPRLFLSDLIFIVYFQMLLT